MGEAGGRGGGEDGGRLTDPQHTAHQGQDRLRHTPYSETNRYGEHGSALIRRLGNADPDPGARKLTKIKKINRNFSLSKRLLPT